MSLSLLEVDLDEKALVAGKQTNNTAKSTQESICWGFFEARLSTLQGHIFIYSAKELPADSNRVSFMLDADKYLSLRFCQHVSGKGVERGG